VPASPDVPPPVRGVSKGCDHLAALQPRRSHVDWRRHETEINRHPQFTAEIDGQNLHFLHVRSSEPDAIPPFFFHGWPESIVDSST
jgi:hypothetical protein